MYSFLTAWKNASAFGLKRKYVLIETQVRFTLNVLVFSFKRKGVFLREKRKIVTC